MLRWDHWHIEVSSICTLKCPRCPRAEHPDSLLNSQLSLDFFKLQLGATAIKEIKKITFCGNDGDPIYCREFIDICQWIKTINSKLSIVIITNGSYKTPDWWKELGKVLNSNDEIHWSLDGWDQHSNEQYRINSNWDSIVSGIKAFCSVNTTSYRVWASIGFKFNEDHLNFQQSLATEWEFDLYQLTKSTKFGSKYPTSYGTVDNLEPTKSFLIASEHRFERESFLLSSKTRPGTDLKILFSNRAEYLIKENKYAGICLIGNKGVFLDSSGRLYPCCWTANRYTHNDYWHQLADTKFNLKNYPFDFIKNDDFWKTEFLKFNEYECQTKCTKEKLQIASHTTEW